MHACVISQWGSGDLYASKILNIYSDCETCGFLKLSYMHINGLRSMSACADHVTRFSPYAPVLATDTRVC